MKLAAIYIVQIQQNSYITAKLLEIDGKQNQGIAFEIMKL